MKSPTIVKNDIHGTLRSAFPSLKSRPNLHSPVHRLKRSKNGEFRAVLRLQGAFFGRRALPFCCRGIAILLQRALPFCCRGHHRFVAPSKTQRTRVVVGLTALFLRPLGVQKGRLLGVQKGRGGGNRCSEKILLFFWNLFLSWKVLW